MAADPDPYFALPKLYGAPAYARPPRVVPESERPFDPDDLPIVAEMTDEERAFSTSITGGGGHQPVSALPEGVGVAVASGATVGVGADRPGGPGTNGSSGAGHGSSGNGSAGSGSAGGAADAGFARRLNLRALARRRGPDPK